MAIKDLYGMGKGGAQVVDLRSVDAMVQNQAEANRKRNEAKAQKRATMISAIDSQLGKLKNTAWYGVSGKDRDYIDKLKSDAKIWMTKTYDTHGEAAFLDNPELKREFDEKAAFIEAENGRSHASIKQADLMLTKSQKNAEDIDTETGAAFDKWMDLPSEVRMRTPMPIIKDRDLTLRELFIEEGMDEEILSSYVKTKRTGAKNQKTGEYNKYEGMRTDEDKYNTTINGLNTNTGGKIFGKANRLAMAEIESDALPPFIDVDGEQVPNPEYQDKLNVTRKRIIEDVAKRLRGTTYENRTRGFGSVEGGDDDEDKDSEVVLGDKEIITESHWSYPGVASGGYFDISGKPFFKTNENLHMVDGKAYLEKNIPKGKKSEGLIPIGTVIDKNFSVRKEGLKGLKEGMNVDIKNVISTGSVTKPGSSKTYKSTSTYSDKEGITKTPSRSKTGKMIGHKLINIKGVETYIFEISDTKGKVTEEIATETLKKVFKKDWEDIKDAENKEKEAEVNNNLATDEDI